MPMGALQKILLESMINIQKIKDKLNDFINY